MNVEKPARSLKGFTLIELLVVISIIALLIAILLPALSAARKSARAAKCLSNVRQLTVAMLPYVNDHNDNTPPATADTTRGWYDELGPYVNSSSVVKSTADSSMSKVALCPSTKVNPKTGGASHTFAPGDAHTGWAFYFSPDTTQVVESGSYGINDWLQPPSNPENTYYQGYGQPAKQPPRSGYFFQHYQSIPLSSQVPVFADAIFLGGWPLESDGVPADLTKGDDGDATTSYGQLGAMGRFCIDRHSMTVNVSFADGHAAPVKLAALWTLRWHKDWQNPSPAVTVP